MTRLRVSRVALTLALLLAVLLAGCRLPLRFEPPAAGQDSGLGLLGAVAPVRGRIAVERSVKADLADIANGATVSLIEVESGLTVATTVSEPDGSFLLVFGAGFVPSDGGAYYLEAIKGIKGPNAGFNQAGADAIRLRTIIFYQAGANGWVSLLSSQPGPIAIGKRTEALSLAIALKKQAGDSLTLADFIGALAPNPYVAVGGLTEDAFNAVYGIVNEAIDQDRDPVQYVTYDAQKKSFLNPWIGFAIAALDPPAGGISSEFAILGAGFDLGAPTVQVNGVTAQVVSTGPDKITARVPPGSRTGPVSVKIGATMLAGPTFTVLASDGHRVLRDGKLYVANPSWGTVAEIGLDGAVKTILTGLGTPTQVAIGPDGQLYVSCRGANKVVKVDLANPGSYTTFATVTAPYGLAFDAEGNLLVSSYQTAGAGSVISVSPEGTQLATYSGFDKPRGLGFDYQGNLFVAEEVGTITKLTPTGPDGNPRTPWGSVPGALGLAVDTAGDLFVASNTNNAIYRIDTFRSQTVFAQLNQPGGLAFDERGSLFVSDTGRNLINRLSPLGDVSVFAYGISSPRGLAIDPTSGVLYVSLNQANAILQVAGGVLKPFVTGIANPLTLTFRGDGMYVGQPDIDTVSFVNREGRLNTVKTGIESASGADQASDGRIFAGRYGRPDAWQPNRDPIYNGGFAIVDAGGQLLPVRYPYVGESTYRAIDDAGLIYDVSRGRKSLVLAIPGPGGTREIRLVYRFASVPGDVTYDAAGNVYVVVGAEGKIYRFMKASGYAKEEIAGFNGPLGLTFSTAGVLYVSCPGNGTLRRVSSPATASAPDAWSAAIPSALGDPSKVAEISFPRGGSDNALYLACAKSVLRYDLTAETFSTHVSDLPYSLSHLDARSNGTIYARAWLAYELVTINADKSYAISLVRSYGGALDWSPTWTYYQSDSYGPQVIGGGVAIGTLGLTHEVAVDGELLYVTSAGTSGDYGGVFRYELTGPSPKELYITGAGGAVYSLAVSPTHEVYAGSKNGHVYLIDTNGVATDKWTLGVLPYGLDLSGGSLWAVGSDSRLFEMPVAGGPISTYYYGIMGPIF